MYSRWVVPHHRIPVKTYPVQQHAIPEREKFPMLPPEVMRLSQVDNRYERTHPWPRGEGPPCSPGRSLPLRNGSFSTCTLKHLA
uniref:Uncharacterized protein n=1 Tax=Picea glauca TaxID=3330 RepID=A0A101M0R8_PICGL|nr:hypothetical protein ABT39_MTgene4255 [Picea glauca]